MVPESDGSGAVAYGPLESGLTSGHQHASSFDGQFVGGGVPCVLVVYPEYLSETLFEL